MPAPLDTLRLAPSECRVDQLVAVVWDVDQFWYLWTEWRFSL